MLKIRSEQMEALEQAAIRNFEQRLLQHLREYFPKHTKLMAEEQLKKVIHYGWERAQTYGLTAENSITLFTDLMFLLGRGFDTDPQLPWAAEILNKELSDEERTQTLYEKAIDYLNRVSGEKNEHIDAAQARIRDEKPEDLAQVPITLLPEQLLRRLKKVFPQKYDNVGEPALHEMIQQGMAAANQYEITNSRGLATYIGLMFMLGASFDTDPQFSWAREVLTDPSVGNEHERTERLYAAGLSYLDMWCG